MKPIVTIGPHENTWGGAGLHGAVKETLPIVFFFVFYSRYRRKDGMMLLTSTIQCHWKLWQTAVVTVVQTMTMITLTE